MGLDPNLLSGAIKAAYLRQKEQEYGKIKTVASGVQAPKLKQTVRDEPLAAPSLPRQCKNRVNLRISQFTRRRQDPDNVCPKYEIDWLRSQGLLADDTDDDIDLTIRQVQVQVEEDEGVMIEIENNPCVSGQW